MIEVNGLVKRFDGFAALDGAALSVPAGSVYGLVGPNGAGKSTLIRHLTGIFRQDAGTVRIGGEDVWENAALKARIAAIPDDWYYFLQSSIRDMVRFYRGFYPAFSMERYEKLKEVFQLDEKRPIRRLSKGMQKQAAFWLALCCMPDYLILDEPVDGLDPVMRRQVWSLVLEIVAQRGTTVLVSSHNLRELEDVCDHVGIMDHGKVLLERSLAQLQDTTVKLQVVFREDREAPPPEIPVLHASRIGRVHTLIMRMSAQEAEARLAAYDPLLVDAVPLTLEEIFIYELGGWTMQSRTSFFNGTLLRKNLTRFWPLWGMASFVGALFPLALVMELLRNRHFELTQIDLAGAYYSVASDVVPVLSLIYAVLCAMAVWNYLYGARSVSMMHAMPIRREGLLATGFLSGMAMMLIPYGVTGGLCVLVSLVTGAFSLKALLVTVLVVLGESFFYFATATFAAFLTGNLFAMPAIYLVLHFLEVILDSLFSMLAQGFFDWCRGELFRSAGVALAHGLSGEYGLD